MLKYVTGNAAKFKSASNFLAGLGVKIEQVKLDIPEIQSDSTEDIAKDKAIKAYELLKEPLFVNDSGWYFLGLNGFPGSFMKYINDWFTVENFLDLTANLKNKEVVLKQVVVYFDGNIMKVFEHDTKCHLLNQAKGNSPRISDNLIAPEGSEISFGQQTETDDFRLEGEDLLWANLVRFLDTLNNPGRL